MTSLGRRAARSVIATAVALATTLVSGILLAAPANAAATVTVTVVSLKVDLTVTTADVSTDSPRLTFTSTTDSSLVWVIQLAGTVSASFTSRIDPTNLVNASCGKTNCPTSVVSSPSQYPTYMPNDTYSVQVSYTIAGPNTVTASGSVTTSAYASAPTASVTSTDATSAVFSLAAASMTADTTSPYTNAPRLVFTGLGSCAGASATVIYAASSLPSPLNLTADYTSATTAWSSTSGAISVVAGSSNLVRGCSYSVRGAYKHMTKVSLPNDPAYPLTSAAVSSWTVPKPPDAPTVSAGPTNAGIQVSWSVPSDTGTHAITGYRITTVPAVTIPDQAANVTSYSLTSLAYGTGYVVQVQALSAAGVGPAASSTSITPLQAGPLTFSSGAFPPATVGQPSSQTITVTNGGTDDLVPTSIAITGRGIANNGGTCAVGTPIAVGLACTVELAWYPSAAGSLTGAALTIGYAHGPSASDQQSLTGIASIASSQGSSSSTGATSSSTSGSATSTTTPTPTPTATSMPTMQSTSAGPTTATPASDTGTSTATRLTPAVKAQLSKLVANARDKPSAQIVLVGPAANSTAAERSTGRRRIKAMRAYLHKLHYTGTISIATPTAGSFLLS